MKKYVVENRRENHLQGFARRSIIRRRREFRKTFVRFGRFGERRVGECYI